MAASLDLHFLRPFQCPHSKRADRLVSRSSPRRSHRTAPARPSRGAWCLWRS